MPQMSPIMWTVILTMLMMTIMQMNSMNFFSSKKKKNFNKYINKKKKINWKW